MNNNLVKLEEKEKKYIIRRYNNNFLFKFYLDLYLSDGLIKIKNNQINAQEFHNNYFNKVKKHLSTTNYSFKTANYNYRISCNENGLVINKSDVNNKANMFASNILFNEIYNEIIQMVNNKTFLTQFENKYLIFAPYLYEALYKKQNNITIDLDGNENEQIAKAIQYIKNIIDYAKHTNSTINLIYETNCLNNEDIKNRLLLDEKFQIKLKQLIFLNYNNGIFSQNNKMIILSQNALTFLNNIDKIKKVIDFDYKINDDFIIDDVVYKLIDVSNRRIQFKKINSENNIINDVIYLEYKEIQRLKKLNQFIKIDQVKRNNQNINNYFNNNAIRGP